MYGYLEGFESMTPAVEILTEEADASDQKRDPDSTDYHKSIDTDILKTLSAEFKHFSGKPPAHPKYNTFIDIVTRKIASSDVWSPATDISDLKHLVFTRRIPSVTEITGRINKVYDEAYLRKIESVAGAQLMELRNIWDVDEFRRKFDEKIKDAVRSREDEAEDGVDEEDEGESGRSDQRARMAPAHSSRSLKRLRMTENRESRRGLPSPRMSPSVRMSLRFSSIQRNILLRAALLRFGS